MSANTLYIRCGKNSSFTLRSRCESVSLTPSRYAACRIGLGVRMSEKARQQGEQSDYQSYLLRLWRVDEGEDGWQASLESTQTGERRGFADLEVMLAYLRRRTSRRRSTPR
jgi:hypothetical protein